MSVEELDSWLGLVEMFSDEHVLLHGAAGEDAMNIRDLRGLLSRSKEALSATLPTKIINAARELQKSLCYARGMPDDPAKGPGNRLADALYEYDQSQYVGGPVLQGETVKALRISINGALRPHIKRLLKQGLNGRTEREVVIRLLCEKLRELQPRDTRRVW